VPGRAFYRKSRRSVHAPQLAPFDADIPIAAQRRR
jgi:hypothetical protein